MAYDSTRRTFFAVGIAGLTTLMICGRLPLIDGVLSAPAWDMVAKLSFFMYLWHPIVIRYFYNSLTELWHWSELQSSAYYLAFLGFTLVLSAVSHVVVELPLMTLERLLLSGGKH